MGTVLRNRMGSMYPALRKHDSPRWYPTVWDLAFSGGWPGVQTPTVRAAGSRAWSRLQRIPPAVRDPSLVVLARGVTLLRPRPRHVVVKSVHSALALEWIAHRYQPRMVVLWRDPLNVVSSWMALGWDRTHSVDPQRPVVREDLLEPLGLRPPATGSSAVTQVAWMVGLLMTALKQAAERNPDWIVVSHDELCHDPRARFRELYARLGLDWTAETDAYLAASDERGFVAHFGNPRTHPNAQLPQADGVRREQQSTQYLRRLTDAQIREAEAVLDGFPLSGWRPRASRPEGLQSSARS
jgi:hypothetical protein